MKKILYEASSWIFGITIGILTSRWLFLDFTLGKLLVVSIGFIVLPWLVNRKS